MSAPDYLAHNARQQGPSIDPSIRNPRRKLVVLTCMDVRLDIHWILGIEPGDAHVLRNAGGVVTDDVIRSLLVSQRLLGTREIVLIHHTTCGLLGLDDAEFVAAVEADTGARPEFRIGGFTDLESDLRESMQRIRTSPVLSSRDVRGFIYDVDTGRLHEVRPSAAGVAAEP